jgi:DNA-binding NarL/FixJ family response regulator
MSEPALATRTAADPMILIADDHALVRAGIRLFVTGMLGTARFCEVADADALLLAAHRSPGAHLALVDLRMPGMLEGMRLAELSRRHPQLPVVVISALNSPDIVRRITAIPTVCAFVPKCGDNAAIRAAIEAGMQRRKLPYVHGRPASARLEVTLTPRQQEIRDLLRQGLRNKTIAALLGISEGTVKNHITDIFRILKATNRTQAAGIGHESE